MKPEKKVTSLELSEKLKEAGAKQDAEFHWSKFKEEPDSEAALNRTGEITLGLIEWYDCAAFDCAELLERLPHGVTLAKYDVLYGTGMRGKIFIRDIPPAEALGRLYLWCLEEGHIKEEGK